MLFLVSTMVGPVLKNENLAVIGWANSYISSVLAEPPPRVCEYLLVTV